MLPEQPFAVGAAAAARDADGGGGVEAGTHLILEEVVEAEE